MENPEILKDFEFAKNGRQMFSRILRIFRKVPESSGFSEDVPESSGFSEDVPKSSEKSRDQAKYSEESRDLAKCSEKSRDRAECPEKCRGLGVQCQRVALLTSLLARSEVQCRLITESRVS